METSLEEKIFYGMYKFLNTFLVLSQIVGTFFLFAYLATDSLNYFTYGVISFFVMVALYAMIYLYNMAIQQMKDIQQHIRENTTAFKEGFQAHLDGISEHHNPYDGENDLENHELWHEGWYSIILPWEE